MNDPLEFKVPVHPKKADSLVAEELEDETIWIDPVSGSSFSLNAVASAILELCDGSNTDEEIAAVVSETLAEERTKVLADTRAILIEFSSQGLIQTAE